MVEERGMVCAYVRGEDGRWREVGWPEATAWRPGQGLFWTHLDRADERARRYLRDESGLDPLIADALVADDTRPRAVAVGGDLLVILRGVNLNPGADPVDMVSVRLWLGRDRIITTRHRRLMAVNDIRDAIGRGEGPENGGEFLCDLAERLVARVGPVIDELEDIVDGLEDEIAASGRIEQRDRLARLRQQAIALRRHLAPQREAMARLQGATVHALGAREQARLRECADRVTRYVEDLDAVRERAGVIQDEVANRISEQINRNMYVLSLVATVMLPLTVITGILGMNIDGMPGTEDAPWAFAATVAAMAAIVVAEIIYLRKRRWL